ncbi:MAG: hypothetical protein ACE360_05190 [Hyphomicrobiales bacterium]
MLPENHTAIITRNETWRDAAASEPYEAGWAREAVLFVRALKTATGPAGQGQVEISPDGMHWISEGTVFALPTHKDEVVAARVSHFGNWLRVSANFEPGAEVVVMVTVHLKA